MARVKGKQREESQANICPRPPQALGMRCLKCSTNKGPQFQIFWAVFL